MKLLCLHLSACRNRTQNSEVTDRSFIHSTFLHEGSVCHSLPDQLVSPQWSTAKWLSGHVNTRRVKEDKVTAAKRDASQRRVSALTRPRLRTTDTFVFSSQMTRDASRPTQCLF